MQNRVDGHDLDEESIGSPAKKPRKSKEPESLGHKKKFMNAFMLFRNGSRQEVKAQYPRYHSKNGIICKYT